MSPRSRLRDNLHVSLVENHRFDRVSPADTFRIARDPGGISVTYFFNPSVKFVTTVMESLTCWETW